MSSPAPFVRSITAIALCGFGERAKPSVPAILKFIEENKGDQLMVQGLFNTLADIDPKAAEKLASE
jgi:hypothetical protein